MAGPPTVHHHRGTLLAAGRTDGYILLWEGSIGQAGTGLSRVAVRTYTSSLLLAFSDDADVRVKFATSSVAAVVGVIVACAIGLALARRLLSRIDTA